MFATHSKQSDAPGWVFAVQGHGPFQNRPVVGQSSTPVQLGTSSALGSVVPIISHEDVPDDWEDD